MVDDQTKKQIVAFYKAVIEKVYNEKNAKGKSPDRWYNECKEARAKVALFAQNQDADVSRKNAFYKKLILDGSSNGIASVKNGWLAIKPPDKKPDVDTVAAIFKDLVSLAANTSRSSNEDVRRIVEKTRNEFFNLFSNFHPYVIFNRAVATVLGDRVSTCPKEEEFFEVYEWFIKNKFVSDDTKRKDWDWFTCNVKLMNFLWECLKEITNIDCHYVGLFVRYIYGYIKNGEITDIARSVGINTAEGGVSSEETFEEKMSDLYWLVADLKAWNGRRLKDMSNEEEQTYSVKGNNKKLRYFEDIRVGDCAVGYQKREKGPEPGEDSQSLVAILQCTRASNGETVAFKKVRNLRNPIRIDFKQIEDDKDSPLSGSQVIKTKCNASLFRLKESEATALKKMIHEREGSFVFLTEAGPLNLIEFGAPGTGKSYGLNKRACRHQDTNDGPFMNGAFEDADGSSCRHERVTFFPTYSYAQFVGTYKPVMKEIEGSEVISYEFVPGPFLRVLVNALKYHWKNWGLIVEEINRANAAAVFGDVFQLLDRNSKGESEYCIAASEDIRKHLQKELKGNGLAVKFLEVVTKDNGDWVSCVLRIPPNMYIWATMNSADQGVFPMDTAFKRRWEFEYIGVDDAKDKIKKWKVGVKLQIGENNVYEWSNEDMRGWNDIRELINRLLTLSGVNEDKLMGPFFVTARDTGDEKIVPAEQFESKVLMYLWEDAARMCRAKLFKGVKTYSELVGMWRMLGPNMFAKLKDEKLFADDKMLCDSIDLWELLGVKAPETIRPPADKDANE